MSQMARTRTKSYQLSTNGKKTLRKGYLLWQRAQESAKKLIPAKRFKSILVAAEDVSAHTRSM
jgi:hypothetical protein